MTYCKTPYIYSEKDCREHPLLPCICGDDGEVMAYLAETYHRHVHVVCIPDQDYTVPVFGNRSLGVYSDVEGGMPYEHFEYGCIGTEDVHVDGRNYSTEYAMLSCVPMEFRRLGPKSRALVMSLYRAILERFVVMRSTGCADSSPFNWECGKPAFCHFGAFRRHFDDNYNRYYPCNYSFDLAGKNRRRIFGGTFREVFKTLMREYCDTAKTSVKCGVTFFPFTPYVENLGDGNVFIKCAKEYENGQPITWWPEISGGYFRKIFFVEGKDGRNDPTVHWLSDNTMQDDLRHLIAQAQGRGYVRPLLWEVKQEISDFFGSVSSEDYYDLQFCVFCRICDELPVSRLKSISDHSCSCQSLGDVCNIKTFYDAAGRFFQGRDMAPQRYWLPALGLALRMLSTLNAQTVRRPVGLTIPHKQIFAQFMIPFGISDSHKCVTVGNELFTFSMRCVNLPCAKICGALSYIAGYAQTSSGSSWYNMDDRVLPEGVAEQSYVCKACFERWEIQFQACSAEESAPAYATLEVTWPDFSKTGFHFGGAAYPAKWAVMECDVAFGAVSAFIKDSGSNKRAWVVNKTDNAKHTLGNNEDDLMTVLGRGLIKAGLQRVMCDVGGFGGGNSFGGTDFPVTQSCVIKEMVGEHHTNNLRLLRKTVFNENEEEAYTGSSFHHLRVLGGCVVGYNSADESAAGTPIEMQEHIYFPTPWGYIERSGHWLNLGGVPERSVAFDYKRDYCEGEDGGMGNSVCVRRDWAVGPSAIQFGGFFGSFIFNNRAAKQRRYQ